MKQCALCDKPAIARHRLCMQHEAQRKINVNAASLLENHMTVEEAVEYFSEDSWIERRLAASAKAEKEGAA